MPKAKAQSPTASWPFRKHFWRAYSSLLQKRFYKAEDSSYLKLLSLQSIHKYPVLRWTCFLAGNKSLWVTAEWAGDLDVAISGNVARESIWELCVIIKWIKSTPWEFECETHRESTNTKTYTLEKCTKQRSGDNRRYDGTEVWVEGRVEAAKSVRRMGSLCDPPELLECPQWRPGSTRLQTAQPTSWASFLPSYLHHCLLLRQGGEGGGENTWKHIISIFKELWSNEADADVHRWYNLRLNTLGWARLYIKGSLKGALGTLLHVLITDLYDRAGDGGKGEGKKRWGLGRPKKQNPIIILFPFEFTYFSNCLQC